MDNNNGDDPVFTSTDIQHTKSKASGAYFTNIQKASFGQKLSEKFAKYRRSSEAKQKAQAESSKAKRAAKRREADLRAMSINIPIAAENGNPALMNTHYAPPPRAKARPLTIVLFCIVIAALIAAIVLAILKPWAPKKPTYVYQYIVEENTDASDEDSEEGEEIVVTYDLSSFDPQTAAPSEGPIYIRAVMSAADTDLYIYDADLEGVDPTATVEHIDDIIKEMDITDTALLTIFELEKARIHIEYGHIEKGLAILEQLNPDELTPSQLAMYYNDYRLYYKNLAEPDKANEYQAKPADLGLPDGLSGDS